MKDFLIFIALLCGAGVVWAVMLAFEHRPKMIARLSARGNRLVAAGAAAVAYGGAIAAALASQQW